MRIDQRWLLIGGCRIVTIEVLLLLLLDEVVHHVNTATLQLLAPDHTSREKYLEDGIACLGKKRLELDGFGESVGLGQPARLNSIPNEEDILKLIGFVAACAVTAILMLLIHRGCLIVLGGGRVRSALEPSICQNGL